MVWFQKLFVAPSDCQIGLFWADAGWFKKQACKYGKWIIILKFIGDIFENLLCIIYTMDNSSPKYSNIYSKTILHQIAAFYYLRT